MQIVYLHNKQIYFLFRRVCCVHVKQMRGQYAITHHLEACLMASLETSQSARFQEHVTQQGETQWKQKKKNAYLFSIF